MLNNRILVYSQYKYINITCSNTFERNIFKKFLSILTLRPCMSNVKVAYIIELYLKLVLIKPSTEFSLVIYPRSIQQLQHHCKIKIICLNNSGNKLTFFLSTKIRQVQVDQGKIFKSYALSCAFLWVQLIEPNRL